MIRQKGDSGMKTLFLPIMALAIWVVRPFWEEMAPEPYHYDVYIYQDPTEQVLAIVSPDPFGQDAQDGLRDWIAELHIRAAKASYQVDLALRSTAMDQDSIRFREVGDALVMEVYEVREANTDGEEPRRFLIDRSGFREVMNRPAL